MRCALALTSSREVSTPRASSASISANSTPRSMTTPLPMTGVHARRQDAGRQQVQGVLLVADDDGVPGVVAAVVLHDVVDRRAEQVGGLALALVAPLGADQHDGGHGVHLPRTGTGPAESDRRVRGRGYVKRLLVVTNAAAGSTDDERVAAAIAVLRGGGGRTRSRQCAEPGDLDGVLDGRDGRTVVLVGGDGSVHTAVDALRAPRRALADRPLGLVPLGTGNDLARTLGIPLDPADAARALLDGSAARRSTCWSTTPAESSSTRCTSAVGAEAAEKATGLKDRLGKAAYPVGSVLAGGRPDRVGPAGRGRRRRSSQVDGQALMVVVANGRTIGGGAELRAGRGARRRAARRRRRDLDRAARPARASASRCATASTSSATTCSTRAREHGHRDRASRSRSTPTASSTGRSASRTWRVEPAARGRCSSRVRYIQRRIGLTAFSCTRCGDRPVRATGSGRSRRCARSRRRGGRPGSRSGRGRARSARPPRRGPASAG